MSAPKGRAPGNAMLYRSIDKAAAADRSDDETYINDKRFDSITEKVIEYMDRTPPEEWNQQQWSLFKSLWQDRKLKRRDVERVTKDLTNEELRSLMSSDDRSK